MSLKKLMSTFKDDKNQISGPVERHLMSLNNETNHRRKYCFHPSSIGKCPRKIQYEFLGAPHRKTIKPQTYIVFAVGHALQEVYFKFAIKAGVVYRRGIEAPLHNYKIHIHGHADFYNRTEHWGIDMKTTKDPVAFWTDGERTEIPFKDLKEPHPEYVMQMQAYMMCDPKATHFQIVYINKNDQGIKEFRVNRDEAMIGEITSMLQGILQANKERRLVDRPPYYLPTKPPCAWCEYKGICWTEKPFDFTVQDEIESGIISLRTGKRKEPEGN